MGSFVLREPRGKYKTAGFFYPAAKIIGTSVLAIFSSSGLASKKKSFAQQMQKLMILNECRFFSFAFFCEGAKIQFGF